MNKFIRRSQVQELEPYVDTLILNHIANGQVERFENLESACLISFDWYNIFDHNALHAKLIIYFSTEHLFFVCESEELLGKVMSVVTEYTEKDKMLFSFFSELLKPDMDYLENLEDEIAEIENNLLIHSKTKCAQSIVLFRKKLIRLKKYYEQLDFIFEDMLQNENGFICHTHLRYFFVLDKRVDRLFNTVLNLRDFVTQVREAYQAQIDIEQNAIMKIFTVITSIFLPLTLIVGWYGMNLRMPEYSWNYGYPMIILFSIVVCLICIAIFKIKKWF